MGVKGSWKRPAVISDLELAERWAWSFGGRIEPDPMSAHVTLHPAEPGTVTVRIHPAEIVTIAPPAVTE